MTVMDKGMSTHASLTDAAVAGLETCFHIRLYFYLTSTFQIFHFLFASVQNKNRIKVRSVGFCSFLVLNES